ncbi:MAG: hypothetical protein ING66_02145 [Rhodocyclaceae bacterium]|nr:hypothetical protein [Rhodocyclaceae bacterium]MCA3019270.1 hypothetical protein [Rhodocyclaceae bacterium]MCA3022117.1 hypothetical protein [Rhodocyclaceae bacterium]MCA3024266.1 hypothetical protein [Rhodocyclaceae bacterium]MCA3027374.1 hypothetical protein [Rhodocyclaceae bacterium]
MASLARHYGKRPDELTGEQLQDRLLFLINDRKLAYASVNTVACGMRFFTGRYWDAPRYVWIFRWPNPRNGCRRFCLASKSSNSSVQHVRRVPGCCL